MEILDAPHAQLAASVHRQVMEAEVENGGSSVVDDLLQGRLELAGFKSNLETTSGSVARNEVPVVKDHEPSITSTVNREAPTAPFINRLTTAPADERTLLTDKNSASS